MAKYLNIKPNKIEEIEDFFYLPTYKIVDNGQEYSVSNDEYDIKISIEESMEHHFDSLTIKEFNEKIVKNLSGNIEDYLPDYDDMDDYVTGSEYNKTVNLEKMVDDVINIYGPGHELALYDGDTNTEEIDGETYYIFRQN